MVGVCGDVEQLEELALERGELGWDDGEGAPVVGNVGAGEGLEDLEHARGGEARNMSSPTSTAKTISTGCCYQPTALGRRQASRGPTCVHDRDILAVTRPDYNPVSHPA